MDTHQLITTAVLVAVGVVVGGLLKWTYSILDAIIPLSAASEKVKRIFSTKQHRKIFWDVVALLAAVAILLRFALDASPITRRSILFGALLSIIVTGCFFALIVDLAILKVTKALSSQPDGAADIDAE